LIIGFDNFKSSIDTNQYLSFSIRWQPKDVIQVNIVELALFSAEKDTILRKQVDKLMELDKNSNKYNNGQNR
jgi:hypothetical protein